MSKQQEAMRLALEALEGGADSWQLVGPAIDALKEALVEDAMQKFTDVNQEIEAALAEPVQEPVAWLTPGQDLHLNNPEGFRFSDWTPLYTVSPQRKPVEWSHINGTSDTKWHPPQRPAEPVQEPVLVVEKEPDYWSRGHFHQGSKPHIDPTKVWNLPIGTKLYTAPPQRKPLSVTDLQDALVYSNLIDRDAIDDPDNYDEGSTVAQIEELHRVITGDNT